jgi:hypothetical protein
MGTYALWYTKFREIGLKDFFKYEYYEGSICIPYHTTLFDHNILYLVIENILVFCLTHSGSFIVPYIIKVILH